VGLQVLRKAGISTEGLRSKSWDEFAAPGASQIDLIISVCNNAVGEMWGASRIQPRPLMRIA